MKARLILIGPPGAGKGTQANVLAQKLEIPTISTGAILRESISQETELGKLAASYINFGNLVPDEVANAIVQERLSRPDVQAGFILDGYPRNVQQVASLDEILAGLGTKLDYAIKLHIPDEAIVSRLLQRAQLENREDDTEEVIRHRIAVYHETTEPLLRSYQTREMLLEVDGTGEVEVVLSRILSALAEVGIH